MTTELLEQKRKRARSVSKLFPTTSVGSFPKPDYLKKARNDFKNRRISAKQLEEFEQKATREWIQIQEELGLDILVDGEMQADTAVVPEIVEEVFPFCEIKGGANVLVFPDLQSANICYKLLQRVGGAEAIGPILVGMNKPINVLQRAADVDEIVNMAMITILEIQKTESALQVTHLRGTAT